MELPSPPEHEDLVWFFIIARNDAAKEALSLTKRQYKDRVGLEVLDEGHPDTEQGLGWLAIPRNGWQSAGFRQNPYNVVTFGHGGSQYVKLPRCPSLS